MNRGSGALCANAGDQEDKDAYSKCWRDALSTSWCSQARCLDAPEGDEGKGRGEGTSLHFLAVTAFITRFIFVGDFLLPIGPPSVLCTLHIPSVARARGHDFKHLHSLLSR